MYDMKALYQAASVEEAVALRLEDGRVAAFPALPVGGTFYLREERTTLRHTEKGYEAYDHETRLTSFFDLRGDDGLTYRMTRTENPDGLGTTIAFTNGKPSEITDAAGRRVRGFLGIEVLVRNHISVFSGDSMRTYVPEDVPEEWRR